MEINGWALHFCALLKNLNFKIYEATILPQNMYGCETPSYTSAKKKKKIYIYIYIYIFESKAVRKIYESKGVGERRRRLKNIMRNFVRYPLRLLVLSYKKKEIRDGQNVEQDQ
jgi:hypothetical protein